jgi:hypothetical protein
LQQFARVGFNRRRIAVPFSQLEKLLSCSQVLLGEKGNEGVSQKQTSLKKMNFNSKSIGGELSLVVSELKAFLVAFACNLILPGSMQKCS